MLVNKFVLEEVLNVLDEFVNCPLNGHKHCFNYNRANTVVVKLESLLGDEMSLNNKGDKYEAK